LWLAQYLLCEGPAESEPCDRCVACRAARRLAHPDLHWFFPLPRPKVSGGSEKLGEALEEARAIELANRREHPFRPTAAGEPAGLYLAHVQVLRRIAQSRPAAGRRKVFVVGDAEHLVPQEASPEAANALLKVLEEPPPDTLLVLTATDPDALLPTLRSRLLSVRLRPLAEHDVVDFLTEITGASPQAARTAARLAQGSIGRALGFLHSDGDSSNLEELRQAARLLIDNAIGDDTAGYAAAHAQAPAGARGATFATILEHLTLWLRDLAAADTGAGALVVNADASDWLRTTIARIPGVAGKVPQAIRAVDRAANLAQFNVNPQLTVAWLVRALRRELLAAP
jgi:DNA polymerase-3 subunit delta'